MRNNIANGGCVAVIGSMTRTMRAQSVLKAAGIRAQIINADFLQSKNGCAYALSYSCAQSPNVRKLLVDKGIRVREYQGE